MARTTVVLALPDAPLQAARCIVALSELDPTPEHDVVLAVGAGTGLDDLLAAVEGDVEVVRGGVTADRAALLRAALAVVATPTCVCVLDGAELAPAAVGHLLAALHDEGIAGATAGDAHPAEAGTIALRPAQLGPVPAVADGVLVAALGAQLARHGDVVPVRRARTTAARPRGGQPLHEPFTRPELSVVVPTLDAASARARACVTALHEHTDAGLEVLLVDNGALPQGFSAPVNAGLRAARGDYLVVCNDDVQVLPGWWGPLRAALDEGHPVAFPRTVGTPMREDLAAWCFALRRDALEHHAAAPGELLHPELVVWYQDTDLLERLRAAGRPPRLVQASLIRHGLSETVGLRSQERPAWLQERIVRDAARFAELHGRPLPTSG